jgi:hypothetical protein
VKNLAKLAPDLEKSAQVVNLLNFSLLQVLVLRNVLLGSGVIHQTIFVKHVNLLAKPANIAQTHVYLASLGFS